MQVCGHRLRKFAQLTRYVQGAPRPGRPPHYGRFFWGITALRHHVGWHGEMRWKKKEPDGVAQALHGIVAAAEQGYAIAESSLWRVNPARPRIPEPKSIKEPGSGTDVPVVSKAALLAVASVPSLPLTKSRMKLSLTSPPLGSPLRANVGPEPSIMQTRTALAGYAAR